MTKLQATDSRYQPCGRLCSRQQGVSLLMAIFILVALSLLGAVMINLTTTSADTVAREVISARALFSAESGAQLKLNELFPPGGSVNTGACGSSPSQFSLGGLVGCDAAVVRCDLTTIDGVNYFTITSTGQCGPAADPAVRVIEVQASDSS